MVRSAAFAALVASTALLSACAQTAATEQTAATAAPAKQAQPKTAKSKKATCHSDNDTGSIIAASACPSRD